MIVVSNTTPLIYLAKMGELELLRKLFKEVFIPQEVFNELIRGKEQGFSDALVIEEAVNQGWINVREAGPERRLVESFKELDKGEVEVLTLAKKLGSELILIDDASGRSVAKSFGFNAKGTLYVLLKAYKNGLLSKRDAKDLMGELVHAGFRVSLEVYVRALRELERGL